eukprot:UN17717
MDNQKGFLFFVFSTERTTKNWDSFYFSTLNELTNDKKK